MVKHSRVDPGLDLGQESCERGSRELWVGRLLADDCRGCKVTARVEIESGRDNYSDRNSIREYVAGGAGEKQPAGIATQPAAAAAPAPKPIDEGEIPF